LLILAQDFAGGFADEEVDMLQFAREIEALVEEMPGTGERPTPARRDDFAHMLPIYAARGTTSCFKCPDHLKEARL